MNADASRAQRRLRQLEKRGRVDPQAGAVLMAGSEARGKSGGLTVSLVAKNVTVEIRADALLDAARAELLALYRLWTIQSLRPDTGGPMPPLKKAAAAVEGRKGGRGYRTGFLADSWRSPKMTGTTAAARARILPPTNRNVFVAEEAKRGVFYLLIGPRHEAVLQEVTDRFVDKAIADAAGVRGVVMRPVVEREAKDQ